MADQREVGDLDRPRREDLLEELRQGAAVLGHVAAAVVADEDGRHRDVRCEPARVGPAAAGGAEAPRELGLHQPVEEHDPGRRSGERGRQRPRLGRDGPPGRANRHGLLEVALLALQRVADQPVEDRQGGAAAGRGRERAAVAAAPPADEVADRAAGDGEGRAGRAVGAVGDRVMDQAGGTRAGPGRAEGAIRDGPVDGADPAGGARELGEAQPGERPQLVRASLR